MYACGVSCGHDQSEPGDPDEPHTPSPSRRSPSRRSKTNANEKMASPKDGEKDSPKPPSSKKPERRKSGSASKNPPSTPIPERQFRSTKQRYRHNERKTFSGLNLTDQYFKYRRTDADAIVEYDMDEEDTAWLDLVNKARADQRLSHITEALFETAIDRLEKEAFELAAGMDHDPTQDLYVATIHGMGFTLRYAGF